MAALRGYLNRMCGLGGDRSAAVAIEFAILCPIFIALLMSAFDIGWLITKTTLLDRALDLTIRQIRTGAATAPTSQAAMKTMICGYMYGVSDCNSVMTVEMTRITGPTDYPSTTATCVDRSAQVAPVVNFTQGARSDIMYVRACMITNALTPYIGIALRFVKDAQGGYSIVSSSAYMNEPGD